MYIGIYIYNNQCIHMYINTTHSVCINLTCIVRIDHVIFVNNLEWSSLGEDRFPNLSIP